MKKVISYLVLIVSTAIVLSACQKYDDGPSFSLSTAKMRLCKLWYIDKVYVNNIDNTDTFKTQYYQYSINYLSKGTYFVKWLDRTNNIENTSTGTWNFSSNKSRLIRYPNSGVDSVSFKILKLKSDQLWLLFENANQEWHFTY